ncbi:MAG: hypothetical protein HY699_01800 [Deltaproteobacteria bacterium]|nr:hypothetical protein [Deltaproteobacteria bacterium]
MGLDNVIALGAAIPAGLYDAPVGWLPLLVVAAFTVGLAAVVMGERAVAMLARPMRRPTALQRPMLNAVR